jgi:hypothetical protein
VGAVVPAVDEGADGAGELADAAVAAAVDGLAFGVGVKDDEPHESAIAYEASEWREA